MVIVTVRPGVGAGPGAFPGSAVIDRSCRSIPTFARRCARAGDHAGRRRAVAACHTSSPRTTGRGSTTAAPPTSEPVSPSTWPTRSTRFSATSPETTLDRDPAGVRHGADRHRRQRHAPRQRRALDASSPTTGLVHAPPGPRTSSRSSPAAPATTSRTSPWPRSSSSMPVPGSARSSRDSGCSPCGSGSRRSGRAPACCSRPRTRGRFPGIEADIDKEAPVDPHVRRSPAPRHGDDAGRGRAVAAGLHPARPGRARRPDPLHKPHRRAAGVRQHLARRGATHRSSVCSRHRGLGKVLRHGSAPGSATGDTNRGRAPMTTTKPRPASDVHAGRTGFPSGGAEGIRTPGLLIANETRYQLRHSPAMREKR